ncbi:hypothetical protein BGP77_10230 [Saccharospirillum sp. MSK14-1]|uniref:DUF58 domain-containing protein n=1 Tax=Saccharospirillum sp. MSK14-1 TaxID=1897632 RepID=UPI000D362751|nr:DUF58 domain-containing protein [Saccharospirillum sp. MSK14-1]PTY38826.1 hypothetical protein BGP77_10230 [Saccharospirillum sp. MSK14-1]
MQPDLAPTGTEVRLAELLALRLIATDLSRLPARLSRHHLDGEQRSRQRGQGREFAELRAYQGGDDVRRIDWRVTARRNEPYLRVFESERRQPQLIWLDLSASLYFGSRTVFKSVLVSHWAAFLGWRLVGLGQPVRLLVTGPGIELWLNLRRPADVAAACQRLAQAHAQLAHTHLRDSEAPAVGRIQAVLAGRPTLWMLSDLDHWTPASLDLALPMQRLNALTLLQPIDAVEAELPAVGTLSVESRSGDRKAREQRLSTDSARVRHRHRQAFNERQDSWQQWSGRRQARWLPITSQTFNWSEVRQWPLPI